MVYDFIEKNHGCVPKEIKESTYLNTKTIYKYIKVGYEEEFIRRIPINGIQRKGAPYTLEGTPKLKKFLEEFRNAIITISHLISKSE